MRHIKSLFLSWVIFIKSMFWRAARSSGLWFTLIAVLLLVGVVLSFVFWDWLRSGTPTPESYGTTIRNVGLLIGGVVALVFAIWRTIVAQQQVDVAQRGLLNDRYQKGAEMLGNNVLSVRLGGIYTLQNLSKEHPEQYHVEVMRLLCAFVRYPADAKKQIPGQDIQAAIDVVAARDRTLIALEDEESFVLDLRSAKLQRMDLSGAQLSMVNLSGAQLIGTNLCGTQLLGANLSGARLSEANLSDAQLSGANLSGTRLFISTTDKIPTDPVQGLTQVQLDEARADPNNPPRLDGVLDAETDEPLIWHGKPLGDEQ